MEFAGLAAIELVERSRGEPVRLVVVHAVGPRIAWFGAPAHGNLLFWDDAGVHTRGAWRMYGGHRLWITRPGADESEETYAADNAPCRVRRLADGVVVTAPPDAARIEKSLAIRVRRGAWTIEHRLRNAGDMLWSGGAWALTCTLPRGRTRYRIPLDGGDPRWDVFTMVVPRRWGGTHRAALADPQFALREDAIAFRALGVEAKRMVFAPRATLEMTDPRRGGLIKRAAGRAHASGYPLNTNLAVYLAPRAFMVELETMSPIAALAPGAVLTHLEHWSWRSPSELRTVRSHADVR